MLDDNEIRNNILAEIHNRLAEISTCTQIAITLLAKLNHEELSALLEHAPFIDLRTSSYHGKDYSIEPCTDGAVGYTKKRGLYSVTHYPHQEFAIGDFERTAPMNNDTGEFLDFSQEAE